ELHVIDQAAVVPVQLGSDEGHRVGGQAGVGQGLGLGVLGGDGRPGGGGGGALAQGLGLGLDDHAGEGVHLALVLVRAGGEGNEVIFHAVPVGQLGAGEGDAVGGEAGAGEGRGAGGLISDVAELAIAGAGGQKSDGQGGQGS